MTVARTGFLLPPVTGSGFATLTDWRADITTAIGFVGLWRFDSSDDIDLESGKVRRVRNWKAGGPTLEMATAANQPGLVTDTTLGLQVATFDSALAQRLSMLTPAFAPNSAWTILVITKPTDYAAAPGTFNIAGAFNGSSTTDRAGIAITRNVGLQPLIRNYYNNAAAQDIILNPYTTGTTPRWTRFLASHTGAKVPKARVDAQPIITGAAGTGTATITTFSVSAATLPYNGRIALVALFSIDLLDVANAALYAKVQGYLQAKYGGLV